MKNKVALVIPTYNERENIIEIIDFINKINSAIDVFIVDDNSPDGTGNLIERERSARKNLYIIHRVKKEGLGPAYIDGFKHVLKNKSYKYIIQMDADFSHNPEDIMRLLNMAKRCDVVVGSRYTHGGGVSEKWSVFRKFLSRIGNLYARLITGLKIKDCTSGFKCYRREALESVNLNKKFLNGYGFQIQILYELYRNGFSICEIPIFFEERGRGKSKMGLNIVFEAFFSLILLRIRNLFIE